MISLTARQVARWRLRRHGLGAEAAPDTGAALARRMCGLHAQVPSAPALIAGVRGVSLDPSDRSLVRTWAMRGTLHLLPADDLDLFVAVLGDREDRRKLSPSWEKQHGVTAAQLRAVSDAVGEVLGPEPLGRKDLAEAICARLKEPALLEPLMTGWGVLLKPAAARGLLCSDGAGSFVSPAGWLGRPLEKLDPADATRELLTRFLGTAGPSTVEDLAAWLGDDPAPVRRLARDLTPVAVDGESGYVVAAADLDELAATPAGGRDPADNPLLLPGFDPWTLAPLTARRRATPPGQDAAVSRQSGWISPVLVVRGAIAGTWRHEKKGRRLAVTVEPFTALSKAAHRACERQARRIAEILGASEVSVG